MAHTYPKITIITASYNAVTTIYETILSVFNQTYPNLEYIIIDGGSTDGTVDILKKFDHQLAYWISEKDDGLFDAMNKGIKVSTGDWIIFLGSDDIFYTNDVLHKIFLGNNIDSTDFIYGDVILKSKGKLYGGSRTYGQVIEKNINHQSIFYEKGIFKKIGLFKLKYRVLSDYEFHLRIFREPSLIKKYIPEIVTLYNDRGISYQFIDSHFYKDHIDYFINIDKLSPKDHRLQTYFFFYGFDQFLNNRKIKGLKTILYSLTFGKRKFYYFLVSIKYFLSLVGFGNKIRTSFVPEQKLIRHYL